MKNASEMMPSRREFFGKILPACAVTCLAIKGSPLFGQAAQTQSQPASPAKHKFDEPLPRPMTGRMLFNLMYGTSLIPLLTFLTSKYGKEKTIELLKEWSAETNASGAQMMAKRRGNNDFATLKSIFNPANPGFQNTLTMEIVESTDRVHELKVTECLYAETFLKAKCGDLGNAAICNGDFAFASAFNPQIELVRDKTLTLGHDCCNHKYVWKG